MNRLPWVMLAVAATLAAGRGPVPTSTLVRWVDGPVRYLLTPAEERAFRALDTEGSRALFIERFWMARDPTEGTLRNEYREEFWARVEDANLRFSIAGPGWKSDRGRVLITLGWPDRIESESFPQLSTLPTVRSADTTPPADPSATAVDSRLQSGYRGVERWHYRSTDDASLGPNLIVAFARDLSDEYRLSSDPSLYLPRFPSGDDRGGFRSPMRLPMLAGDPTMVVPSVTPLPELPTVTSLPGLVRFELVDLADARSPRELATEVVTAEDFLDLLPVRARWLFFLAPDGRTTVAAGLSVPGPALYGTDPPQSLVSYLLSYLSFLPEGDADAEEILANNEASPRRVGFAESGGRLEAWSAAVLAPGRYRVALGLMDAATGRVASLREDLDVPDLAGEGPRLSSLVLAASLAGGVDTVPAVRAPGAYRQDESFALYYELYGMAASYRVAYAFEVREADAWRPLGQPVEPDPRMPGRQGWEFPLAGFPPGEYRLTVTARDQDSREDRRSIVFAVAAAGADPAPADGG